MSGVLGHAGLLLAARGFVDTFDTYSIGEYTEFADSAAFWAITSERLAGTGGSQALFVRNGFSATDTTIACDAYACNDGGLALRVQDTNNYYVLLISDASSDNGSANTLRFFKRVGGSFSKLGADMAITFPRNSNHRVTFGISGTTLSASFDGGAVETRTDSSISGAGGVSMRHSGGTPSFYDAFYWDQ